MYKLVFAIVSVMALSFTSPASAFDWSNRSQAAEASIAQATELIEKMSDGQNKGLSSTLLDEAKILLSSANKHHENTAAGLYSQALAHANATAAKGYADAATILAGAGTGAGEGNKFTPSLFPPIIRVPREFECFALYGACTRSWRCCEGGYLSDGKCKLWGTCTKTECCLY